MKPKIYTAFMLLLFSVQLFAQCGQRYKEMIFQNVTTTTNITYSTSNNTTLKLDVYEPQGDTASMRPLIVLAHGGSFVSGNKSNDNVVTTLCTNFAKRGYVCASIDYRLASFLDMLDSSKAINEVMMAISDGKSAVRFFRKDAATTNTYKIDPNHIFVGGNSAGSVLFQHYISIDSVGEAPPSLQAIINNNGGIEGNSGNDGYSSEVHALINCAGGLNVPEFVGPGTKPVVHFHGDADNVVPYGCANAQGGATPVRLCGLGALDPLYQQYNVTHVSVVFPGDGHCPWASDNAKMTKVDTTAANFLYYTFFCTSGVGIKDMAKENEINVYPNPATEQLNVLLTNTNDYASVQLLDGTGRIISEKAVSAATTTFERGQIPAGVYFVKVMAKDATFSVKRVVFE